MALLLSVALVAQTVAAGAATHLCSATSCARIFKKTCRFVMQKRGVAAKVWQDPVCLVQCGSQTYMRCVAASKRVVQCVRCY